MLLGEVGKLREEKRALQQYAAPYSLLRLVATDLVHSEIGSLLCLKSKYGPGGEFDPDWYVSSPCALYAMVTHIDVLKASRCYASRHASASGNAATRATHGARRCHSRAARLADGHSADDSQVTETRGCRRRRCRTSTSCTNARSTATCVFLGNLAT
jgi:hypothetical protein